MTICDLSPVVGWRDPPFLATFKIGHIAADQVHFYEFSSKNWQFWLRAQRIKRKVLHFLCLGHQMVKNCFCPGHNEKQICFGFSLNF